LHYFQDGWIKWKIITKALTTKITGKSTFGSLKITKHLNQPTVENPTPFFILQQKNADFSTANWLRLHQSLHQHIIEFHALQANTIQCFSSQFFIKPGRTEKSFSWNFQRKEFFYPFYFPSSERQKMQNVRIIFLLDCLGRNLRRDKLEDRSQMMKFSGPFFQYF
jgi:hypothetical protein